MTPAAPRKVVDVETAQCAQTQGTHVIVNLQTGSVCIHCGNSWADLDHELNGERT